MFRIKQLAWAVSCALLMDGCAWYQNKDRQTVDIRPVMEVNHALRSADAMYQLGRYHQGRVYYPKAIAAYENALETDPRHVEAHNGLGVAHCLQGRHELALQYLRRAIELAPLAGHLRSNLGYAHLARGEEAEATVAFEHALRLDPANHRARRALAAIHERAGLHDKAAALKTARPEPAATAAAASVKVPAPVPAFNAASVPAAVAATEKQKQSASAVARLVQITPGVFEFRMAEAGTATGIFPGKITGRIGAPQHSGKLDRHSEGTGIRIEISNGNGVVGMAKQVSDFLVRNGYARARLTDREPYRQVPTEIHYRPGYSRQAGEIARMMPAPVPAVESYNLRKDIHVRVLLGRDVAREVTYFGTPGGVQVADSTSAPRKR